MVGTAIAGGAVALLGQYLSAKASRKANDAAKGLLAQERQKNKDWWEIKRSSDPTLRADAQAVITKQRELLNDANYLTRATAKVAGGSEESIALQKEANNKAAAQTMSALAAQGAAEKREDEREYRATDAALVQQEIQTQQQVAAQNAAAGAQAVNAGVNLLAAETRNLGLDKKPKTE